MKKNLLIAAALFAYAGASAQCEEPELALNEDFSEFTITTSEAFPQNCWSANTEGPMMYTEETEDESNQFVVYYNMGTAGAVGYLVSPALSNVDGSHTLSFTTWKVAAPGGGVPTDSMLVQVGTLTDPADFETFSAFGAAIDVTADAVNHADIVIPEVEGNAHIAFKIIGSGIHNAVAIDDVVWTAVCEPVTALDENFDNFMAGASTISQECWSASAGMPLVYVDGDEETGDYSATFYAGGSANTAAYLVSPELSNIDGAHQLSFDAVKIGGPAPVTTVQVGTIAEAGDFASFTAVGEVLTLTADVTATVDLVFPASEHKFIAFKFLTDNIHGAAGVDNVVWEETPMVCEAVTALDENFDGFTAGIETLDQDCWTASAGMPLVYVDGDEETGDNYPTFYAGGSANTAGYLVSPELSNIDGVHQLSFNAFKIGGPAPVTTVQVGTIAEAGDFASFTAVGEVLTLTADVTATVDLVFPASEHKFIAFKFLTDNIHGAAGVDNVVWEPLTAGIADNAKNAFSIYPNPSNGLVSLTRDAAASGAGLVSVYSITGAKVFETTVASGVNTQEFDLSGLASGMYLVKFESGNATAAKKLVIK